MNCLRTKCKPAFERSAKCLKNGADYPVRTDDPLITKHGALLIMRGFPVNRALCEPQKTVTLRSSVNRFDRPTGAPRHV